MAFFEDLSRTISDKGKEAALKAKEAAEALQIKAQIASEKGKLKELYGAVGVLYFKKHRDEEDNEFGDLFREIDNVLANVTVMEEKLQGLEGANVCPNCKKVMKKDAKFCCYCGTLLKTETEEEAEEEDVWEDGELEEETKDCKPAEDPDAETKAEGSDAEDSDTETKAESSDTEAKNAPSA